MKSLIGDEIDNVYRTKRGFIPTFDVVVCNFSFGLGSYCAAKRMVDEFGPDRVMLLFADVKAEDKDTYDWGRAAAKTLGCKLVEMTEGRTPWQVFEDHNFIGNSRVDMCSKELKREFIDKYLKAFFNPHRTLLVFGIHWSEGDRFERRDRETGALSGIYWRLRDIGWRYSCPFV